MAKGLPCPNPTCSHVFAPQAIQGTTALSCPRCGTVYRFRKPAPPPPPPPPRSSPRLPPLPLPAPVVPPAAPRGLEFEPSDEVVAPRPRRRSDGSGRMVIGCFLFLLLAGGAGWAIWEFVVPMMRERTKTKLPAGWANDDRIKGRFKANQAMSREGPSSWMALVVRDYKSRDATDAELLREAKRFLEMHFEMMQYQAPASRPTGDDAPTVGGVPALVFPFEGRDKESKVPMKGRCAVLSHQGYAYWMYTWGPQDHEEALLDDWEKLRAWITLRKDRDGWRPTPRPSDTFTSPELPYQISYVREVWSKEPIDKGEEERPELVLHGHEWTVDEKGKKARGGPERMAIVRAYSWPRDRSLDDAIKAGLGRVQQRVKMDTPDAVVVEMGPKERGTKVGALAGRVLRLEIKSGDDDRRFALLAIAWLPQGTIGIYCECGWKARDSWLPELMELVGSVRAAKAGP